MSNFSGDLESVAVGDYDGWATPYDKLAAILVADQLTRRGPRDPESRVSLLGYRVHGQWDVGSIA